MTILDQLAAYARERVNEARRKQPFEELKKQALSLNVSAREHDLCSKSNAVFHTVRLSADIERSSCIH